ncbi:hypothetical protein ACFWNK_37990 [Streptomyces sp. NPDC058417]|uniref:hypothetical protein n=1 Tax=unclassified Streptomyces TaxID=2593676 RepID=UPI0036694E1B
MSQQTTARRPLALRLFMPPVMVAAPANAGQRFDPVRQVTVGVDGTPTPSAAITTPTAGGPLSPRDCEANKRLL